MHTEHTEKDESYSFVVPSYACFLVSRDNISLGRLPTHIISLMRIHCSCYTTCTEHPSITLLNILAESIKCFSRVVNSLISKKISTVITYLRHTLYPCCGYVFPARSVLFKIAWPFTHKTLLNILAESILLVCARMRSRDTTTRHLV